MERLEIKYTKLLKGLRSLQRGISRKDKNRNPEDYEEWRDSTIKRFEFCFDMLWKYLKIFIEDKHGLAAPSSPKGIFVTSRDIPIISHPEYEALLRLLESRNMTSHTYEEELAEEITAQIPSYYQTMIEIALRLTASN